MRAIIILAAPSSGQSHDVWLASWQGRLGHGAAEVERSRMVVMLMIMVIVKLRIMLMMISIVMMVMMMMKYIL